MICRHRFRKVGIRSTRSRHCLGFDETEYLALFLWLAIAGAGRFSIDRLLNRSLRAYVSYNYCGRLPWRLDRSASAPSRMLSCLIVHTTGVAPYSGQAVPVRHFAPKGARRWGGRLTSLLLHRLRLILAALAASIPRDPPVTRATLTASHLVSDARVTSPTGGRECRDGAVLQRRGLVSLPRSARADFGIHAGDRKSSALHQTGTSARDVTQRSTAAVKARCQGACKKLAHSRWRNWPSSRASY